MHKIINEYIESDKSVVDILSKVGDASQPVEMALLLVSKQLNKASILPNEKYEIIDEALEKGHHDKEVFLLFISNLIAYYCLKEKNRECESTFKISSSFNIDNYLLEIQAHYYQACAYYHINVTKDYAKRDEANQMAISKMPKNSPRYLRFLSNMAQILGVAGRLQELPREDLEILEKYSTNGWVSLEGLMSNALYTVNLSLVDRYLEVMETKFKGDVRFRKEIFISIRTILQGDFSERTLLGASFNACLLYYLSLKSGNLELAKKSVGNIKESYLDGNCFGLFDFINFQHAFVTGRFEIIEKILKESENQSDHYMLDFFLVRYFLIKKNKHLAKFYYSRLLNNCERFQAMGRLQYEMQFAFEMSVSSFFELTQTSSITITGNLNKPFLEDFIKPENVLLGINKMIGGSKAVVDIKKKIKKYANLQRSILVVGETGSGKEIVARAIHEESDQRSKPFLAINCGVLTDTLLQSELFGYEAGAFTGAVTAHKGIFEVAEDGIVFLDEFGEMSPKLQVSLLRVFENNEILRVGGAKTRKIHCRIIAATNADIESLIIKKLFRDDLYHRLKQFSIAIPPLRDRKEDIPELINYFLNSQKINQLQKFSNELLQRFLSYHWPGNIRELKNEIDRIKILCGYKPIIELQDVDIDWLNKNQTSTFKVESSGSKSANRAIEEMHQRINVRKITFADMRCQQILPLFQQYKQLTRGQIAQILQVSLLTVTKDLKRLCAEGVIIKRMPTKSPRSHYFEINIK